MPACIAQAAFSKDQFMITTEVTVQFDDAPLRLLCEEPEHALYFDIETTGFRAASSHLYLIGAAWKDPEKKDTWILRQILSEYPQEETALLRAFAALSGGFDTLVHYNGDRFDIPYLKEKYEGAGLPDPILDKRSVDLYKLLRPFKASLGLSGLKQRDVEELLRLYREDPYDGGQLIRVYRDFVKTGDAALKKSLLLHNREDVSGMLLCTGTAVFIRLFSYLEGKTESGFCLHTQSARIKENGAGKTILQIPFTLPPTLRFPAPLSRDDEIGSIRLKDQGGVVSVFILEDTLYHYFPDWQNYYYLPAEDTAIHKSVASFVDPKWRQKATAQTCYTKRSGQYLPCPGADTAETMQRRWKDPVAWIPYSKALAEDPDFCRQLALWGLRYILRHPASM